MLRVSLFAVLFLATMMVTAINAQDTTYLLQWGTNAAGELGVGSIDGTTYTRDTPIPALTQSLLASLDAELTDMYCSGDNFTLAVTSTNQIIGWGSNVFGTLLVDPAISGSYYSLPLLGNTSALGSETITSIHCGALNAAVVTDAGRLYVWGRGDLGVLGTGSTATVVQYFPVMVNATDPDGSGTLSWSNSVSIGNSGPVMFAIDSSLRLLSWGLNSAGRLGQSASMPTSTTVTSPDFVNSNPYQNETVFGAWIYGNTGVLITNDTRRVFVWGSNLAGQFGTGSTDTSAHNTPQALANSPFNSTGVIPRAMYITTSISRGLFVNSVDSDEIVGLYSWGSGQTPTFVLSTEVPGYTAITDVWAFVANDFYIKVLDDNANVYVAVATGLGNPGTWVVPYWTLGAQNLPSSTFNGNFLLLWQPEAVPNGAVVKPTSWPSTPRQELALSNALSFNSNASVVLSSQVTIQTDSISSGLNHTLMLLSNGQVIALGDNSYGQLGVGDSVLASLDSFVYVDFSAVGNPVIVQVAAGNNHNLALASTGQVYCWGRNNVGQCGNQGETDPILYTPIAVNQTGQAIGSPLDFSYIAAGPDTSAAISAVDVVDPPNVFVWGDGAGVGSCTTNSAGSSYVTSGTLPVSPVRFLSSGASYPFVNLTQLPLNDYRRQLPVAITLGNVGLFVLAEGPYTAFRNVYACGLASVGDTTLCRGTGGLYLPVSTIGGWSAFAAYNPVQITLQGISTSPDTSLIYATARYSTDAATANGYAWGCGDPAYFTPLTASVQSAPFLFLDAGQINNSVTANVWQVAAGPTYATMLGYKSSTSNTAVYVYGSGTGGAYTEIASLNSSRYLAPMLANTSLFATTNWVYTAELQPPAGVIMGAVFGIMLGATLLGIVVYYLYYSSVNAVKVERVD